MPSRVLFVDDEKSLLFAAREYLTQQGFEVECAQEWEEAQALLANATFDVVITDIRLTNLQGAEGLHVLDFIRHQRLGVPVVVLTAHASPAVEDEARRLGAQAIFCKPVPLPRLAAEITRLMEARR
jgi:DNA-binding NtrC family response regulator